MERKEYEQTLQCIKREKEEGYDRLSLSLKESRRVLKNQRKNLKKNIKKKRRISVSRRENIRRTAKRRRSI